MNNIPAKLNEELNADPYYTVCARRGLHGHVCGGRITREHTLTYASNQIQERWAIIPICAKAHAVDRYQDGGDFNKEINQWIALNRATEIELRGISKAIDYIRLRNFLNSKYGLYCEQPCGKAVDNPVDSVFIKSEFSTPSSWHASFPQSCPQLSTELSTPVEAGKLF